MAAKDRIPETLEEAIGLLTGARSRISELNAENETQRGKLNTSTSALEALQRDFTTVQSERDAARARITKVEPELADLTSKAETATRELEQARTGLKESKRDASLQVAAIQAGMVDLDALALVDRAGLELDDAGALKDGAAVMAKLKEAKPYLFGAAAPAPKPGEKKVTTSPPGNPPKPGDPKPFKDLTDAEKDAAFKDGSWKNQGAAA